MRSLGNLQKSAVTRRRQGRQSGFTLIEVLISLIILAVGFLGLAALQSGAVQGLQSTYFRTQADLLVSDLAERMRGNRAGAKNGGYEFSGGSAPSSGGCSGTSPCDSTDMAAYDLSEWVTWVANSLPAGDAVVTRVADNFWSIQVMWDERRTGAAGTGCDPTNADDMACLMINMEMRDVDLNKTF